MSIVPAPLRQAVRRLVRSPVFTITALVTLAVGIGANTAIFSMVNGVLLRPLPFPEPDRLVSLWYEAPGLDFEQLPQSPATYLTIRSDSRSLEDVALWTSATASVTGLEEPEEVPAMMVTDAFFGLLGAVPATGRLFTAEDDAPGSPRTAVLGHAYWERQFGSDPSVVGRTLTLDGRIHEVVGVAPAGFEFRGQTPDVFYTARIDPADVFMGNFSYQAFGRMAPGTTVERLRGELDRLTPVASERYPGPLSLEAMQQAGFAPVVRPLKQDVVGDMDTVLWVLLGTVGIILLIACANVANLFLVRAEGRAREVAVRTALGADRWRVGADFLLESVTLGLVAGGAGLLLAQGGLELLLRMAPGRLPRMGEIGLDPAVLLFTAGISVLAGLLFGLFPLVRFRAAHLVSALKEGSRGSSQGKERHRTRNALVVAQVAMALVLLAGSGLMIRSFQALRNVDPGVSSPEALMTFRVGITSAQVPDAQEVLVQLGEIQRQLSEIPGVRAVGGISGLPMGDWNSNDPIVAEGFPVGPDEIPPIRRFKWMLPGYLEAAGTSLVAGRDLTWTDLDDRADVSLISENLAREYWERPEDAIGKRIRLAVSLGGETPRWREIVGVVGDTHEDGMHEDPVKTVYWPAIQTDYYDQEERIQRSMAFALRVEPAAMDGLRARIQEAVWGVNPNLPLANVRTMDEIVASSLSRTSFTLVLLGIAAAVALLLGAVGIYGVISYSVSQRTREMGIRMALGAEGGDVRRMVVGQGMLLTAAGLLLGIAGAAGATRLMESLLYGVEAFDPLTYLAVAVVLGAVAALASWLPARRAAALDPAMTLRQE